MYPRIRKSWEIGEAEVTPEALYRNRRQLLRDMGVGAAGLAASGLALGGTSAAALAAGSTEALDLSQLDYRPGENTTGDDPTPYEAVTTYNNFYEFGTNKADPAKYAHAMAIEPWSISVEGECEKPGQYALEDLIPFNALEERIYRLRCVEAWSMVIPWIGVSLKDVVERLVPTSKAKYVAFETYANPKEMRGLNARVLDWPYVEGLRLDEALHPLTLLAVGLYGKVLPKQNGAPVRLVVPWKYGFKSIKSIVRIRFVERQPKTAWVRATPREYGFYSNVNPEVDHPRWSQARERRIGEFFKRDTLMFNGYADEVAHLYAGMDLKKYY